MQSIQFGGALLQDETETAFVWLFKAWLDAMGGQPPTSIITDQDLGMKGAIAKMFLFTNLIFLNCQFYSLDLEDEAEGSDSDQEEGSDCSE
ncbi:hypothetical protein RHMOL_Rhmol11G0009700 [Rhododendron molle]|uniref:Uncharacterized protein n=1 Tax=Rhododendron molle TaxID=49168 RepID=A0ACC0LMN2_RHOML|nr:hypothetical protein RHMOL_Rhmol11G0009700 [Rhododendron molle]